MAYKHGSNWMDHIDDEDFSLLGGRFSRAIERHEKRRDDKEDREGDWKHRSRRRIRPEPYRERHTW